MPTYQQIILKSHLSRAYVSLDEKQTKAVLSAIDQCCAKAILLHKDKQAREVNKEAVSLIPAIVKGSLRLWLRNWYFKRAKKQAQLKANIENRKTYVIRKSEIAYQILTTKEVELNKRLRIFGKDVDAISLRDNADAICYPEGVKPRYVKKIK